MSTFWMVSGSRPVLAQPIVTPPAWRGDSFKKRPHFHNMILVRVDIFTNGLAL